MPGVKGRSGRRAHSDRPIEKSINLPESLLAEVELRLVDPASDPPRVRYGAFGQLVERLLREWLQKGARL